MPKKCIAQGLRSITEQLQQERQVKGVAVPARKSERTCAWKPRKGDVWIPFEDLIDILKFSLDNAITTRNGKLLWQRDGIPMGDPLSPGMCIGACAAMEQKWLANLPERWKQHFRAKRYMDDILIIAAENPRWEYNQLEGSLSACYDDPLKLEKGKDGVW